MAMQFCIKFDGNPVRSGLRRRSRVFDAEPLFLRLKRAAAVLVFGSSLAWSQSPPAQITAVRFWSFAEVTRIVIDTSAPCEFKTGQAQAPDRLYLVGTLNDARVDGDAYKGFLVLAQKE